MDFTTHPPEQKTPPADAIPSGRAVIVVEAAGVGAPLIVRVKRAIKFLSRTHGLRCISVDLPKDGEVGK